MWPGSSGPKVACPTRVRWGQNGRTRHSGAAVSDGGREPPLVCGRERVVAREYRICRLGSEQCTGCPRSRVCPAEAGLLSLQQHPQIRFVRAQRSARPVARRRVCDERCVAAYWIRSCQERLEPGLVVDRKQDPGKKGSDSVGSSVPDL